mmetsp:Transcript_25311/g.37373  ORF Transcript_25311/g.37373 Transcript_25311/m.37373 type:complete len:200 (+) Transcript_25311:741-1340(+)
MIEKCLAMSSLVQMMLARQSSWLNRKGLQSFSDFDVKLKNPRSSFGIAGSGSKDFISNSEVVFTTTHRLCPPITAEEVTVTLGYPTRYSRSWPPAGCRLCVISFCLHRSQISSLVLMSARVLEISMSMLSPPSSPTNVNLSVTACNRRTTSPIFSFTKSSAHRFFLPPPAESHSFAFPKEHMLSIQSFCLLPFSLIRKT